MLTPPKDEELSYLSPATRMIAQSPTGSSSSTVEAPTMTAAGPILQPPKANDLTPSIPTSTSQLAPAPSPTPTPAAPTPPTVTPGSTAPSASAANLNMLPAPTPQQLAPPAPVTTGTGAGAITTQALSGEEQPSTVAPTMSGGLQSLLDNLRGEAGRQLAQPTVWDDELAGQIKAQQQRGIDENFTREGDALNAELASRGLDWSSIAGSRLTDLGTRKAQALSDVDTTIARERANALAAGRSSAFTNASGLFGSQFGAEQTLQNAARGERDYTTTAQQQAWQNAMQEAVAGHSMSMDDESAWLQSIMSGLNYGTGAAGTAALNAAAGINTDTGSQYGQQASDANGGLSSLLQLAMQFYGGQ